MKIVEGRSTQTTGTVEKGVCSMRILRDFTVCEIHV
jgi:hypothetical protein